MFDARVVCLIRFQPFAFSSAEALRELKELLGWPARSSGSDVVQVRHQSRSRKGGSDALRHEIVPGKPTAAVPPAGPHRSSVSFGRTNSKIVTVNGHLQT
jgi:hypothetical protein